MSDAARDERRDLAIAYLLGSLSPAERSAFEARLATDPEGRAELAAFRATLDTLGHGVPQVEPPARLRARVLEAIGTPPGSATSDAAPVAPPAGSPWGAWLLVAASLVAAVGMGAYALQLRRAVVALEVDLARAIGALDDARSRLAGAEQGMQSAQVSLAVLTAPDIVRVDLAGQTIAEAARGRAFWSRATGVVFVATGVPEAPRGTTYQLWLVPASGAPVSAGIAVPDATGRLTIVTETRPDVAAPAAFAVTREPAGGVPAPTGDKYLVGIP
jgi:anti-sigma-K factor RskA